MDPRPGKGAGINVDLEALRFSKISDWGNDEVVEVEEDEISLADDSFDPDDDESLPLDPFDLAGMRMTFWWKVPLTLSV